MTDHFHDARNLVRRNNTPPLALGDDLIGHLVLLRFENGSLV
jgi:hypothetical protein